MATGPTEPPTPPARASRRRAPTSDGEPPGPPTARPGAVTLSPTGASPASTLPRWLHVGGAWSWRLIAIGVVALALLRFLIAIEIVVLPFLAATVFTALLRPTSLRLQRHGVSPALATWATFLIALIVVLGVGTLVVYRAVAEWHILIRDFSATSDKVRHWLTNGPLHLKNINWKDIQTQIGDTLNQHRGAVASGILSGASIAAEVLAGTVLTAFITFFLLYDGENIWRFAISGLRPRSSRRIDRAARAAWHSLAGYLRGTLIIATIHAAVMAISLYFLGVPLMAPLAVLVFVSSFVPLVGVLVGGGVSVFVTFGTHGLTAGLVLLVILVVEHQVEGHLLQPFIMSRAVRLHPLGVVLALSIGSVLGGIIGAIMAVPVVAALHAAWPHLRSTALESDDPPGDPYVALREPRA